MGGGIRSTARQDCSLLFPLRAKKKSIRIFERTFEPVRTQEWLATDLIRCTSSAPAEQLGELNPDGVQRLLNQADWESEKVMSALRAYVVEQIGSQEGVLIVDETGFLKKGQQSAGVKGNTVARRAGSRTLR